MEPLFTNPIFILCLALPLGLIARFIQAESLGVGEARVPVPVAGNRTSMARRQGHSRKS